MQVASPCGRLTECPTSSADGSDRLSCFAAFVPAMHHEIDTARQARQLLFGRHDGRQHAHFARPHCWMHRVEPIAPPERRIMAGHRTWS